MDPVNVGIGKGINVRPIDARVAQIIDAHPIDPGITHHI